MPGKSRAFTTHVEAGSPPWVVRGKPWPRADLVEAPGTAPGSVTLILRAVYRHSRSPDTVNIGGARPGRNRGIPPSFNRAGARVPGNPADPGPTTGRARW